MRVCRCGYFPSGADEKLTWQVVRFFAVPIILVLAGGTPSVCRAYLMDAFDARVADYGTLEIEVQPAGYFLVDSEGLQHYLVAPSIILYLGFAERLDLVVASRGFLLLNEVEGLQAYHSRESAVSLRWLLLEGAYNDGEGPSLAIQTGVLLPNFGVDPTQSVGAQVGALFAQTTDMGTVHVNQWISRTAWESWDLFVPVAYEGPGDWPVRPLVEVWLDYDTHPELGGTLLSLLLGAYVDLSETLTVGAGVRHANWSGEYSELEVRLSLWWQLPIWESEPSVSDDTLAARLFPG